MHTATVSSTSFSKIPQMCSGAIYDLSAEFSFPEQNCSIPWARRWKLRVPVVSHHPVLGPGRRRLAPPGLPFLGQHLSPDRSQTFVSAASLIVHHLPQQPCAPALLLTQKMKIQFRTIIRRWLAHSLSRPDDYPILWWSSLGMGNPSFHSRITSSLLLLSSRLRGEDPGMPSASLTPFL